MPQSHSHTDRASARSLATRELTHEAAAARVYPCRFLTSETVSGILADLSLRLGWARELELISEGYLGPGAIKHNYRLLAEVSVDVMTLSNGMISPGDGSVIRDLRHRPDGSIIVLDTCGRLQLLIPLASGEWRVELPLSRIGLRALRCYQTGALPPCLQMGRFW